MINQFNVEDIERAAAKLNRNSLTVKQSSSFRKKKLHKKLWDIFLSCLTRIVFVVESAYVIYYLCVVSNNYYFCFLITGMVLIAADGAYVVIRRHGKEHLWFSISSFTYTGIMLISIWFLAFDKFFSLENKCNEDKQSNIEIHEYFWNAVTFLKI
jgi:hypothetical protein